MNTLYRCYNTEKAKGSNNEVVGSSLFDLIGKKEPDQTKALGYVLARSEVAMEAFLSKVFEKESNRKTRVNELMKQDCIVDCELRLENKEDNADRADIVIRFPNKGIVIIVEAKSPDSEVLAKDAYKQAQEYAKSMGIKKEGIIVTITTYKSQIIEEKKKNWCSLQWSDIVDMFDEICKDPNLWLENDFLNYILKIGGVMKYYDVEVLSIPATTSLLAIEAAGIYECPYAKYAKYRPLFVAFRGKGDKDDEAAVRRLWKIEDIKIMPIAGEGYKKIKERWKKSEQGGKLIDKIEMYKTYYKRKNKKVSKDWKSPTQKVFFLEEAITLPHPVICHRNNSNIEKNRPLKDYFAFPKHTTKKGEKCVKLKKIRESQE